MAEDGKILIGKSTKLEYLDLRLANRHGLVTGATGTGKPLRFRSSPRVFGRRCACLCGGHQRRLSGVAAMGDGKPPFVKRAQAGIEYCADSYPVVFWDLFGEQGLPIRATITEMGPLLVSRLLNSMTCKKAYLTLPSALQKKKTYLSWI